MILIVFGYDDLGNYDDNYDFADDEYKKIGSIRKLFKEFDRDYYKPIRTNDKTKGGRYENLSTEEYFKMVRPYLGDLINDHKPTTESNNKENEENDSDDDRVEWKIQLVMQHSCISTKNFEETCTIYSASEPV